MHRIRTSRNLLDRWFLRNGHRLAETLNEYRYLIAVLLIGFVVWAVVFNIALVDYLNSTRWTSRTAWLGPLPDPAYFDFLGFTIEYQFEGYSDYSFYYVHWGYNLLNGVMPYSGEFGYLEMDGLINENGAYMFPPLTAYLYAFGIALGNIIGPGNWGIGLLFAIFGYLTTLPVYGIAKEFSGNPRVGEIAALTYVINPLVLYHIDYIWLNPAPFYFFFFAGFYALLKKRRNTAIILIVTAALFKQTAWFLGIPLVVHLIMRARERKERPSTEYESVVPLDGNDAKMSSRTLSLSFIKSRFRRVLKDRVPKAKKDEPKLSTIAFIKEFFDLRVFLESVIVAVLYVGAIMLPYILAQPHFLSYWQLATGYFNFENFVDPIAYNVPERLPILLILNNMPELAELLDLLLLSSGPFFFGIIVFTGLMILLDKYKGEETRYLRRLLFFTFLLMLWTNLTGPRGVFKYYFTMFAPFFSIFSSYSMTRYDSDHVPVSASMIWMPISFTLLILLPDRDFYLAYVIGIFLWYILAPLFARLYGIIKKPFGYLKTRVGTRIDLAMATITVQGFSHPSKIHRSLGIAIVVVSGIAGSSLVILGVLATFTVLELSIQIIMQYLLLTGAIIFIGMQFLSIALTYLQPSIDKITDLNYTLKTLSYTLAGLILIFGGSTYILSWNIDSFLSRQLMVISGVICMIWTFALVLKTENRTRLLIDIFLLIGTGTATWVWFNLVDTLYFPLGIACMVGIVIHLMTVLLKEFRHDEESVQDKNGELTIEAALY
ncbi:MAG: hypothetical protein JW779_12650 [Candidatus Thorarchaeota archaeon]|nr:hypothetical protein [Candidatus Thorarchaeota archaeon]